MSDVPSGATASDVPDDATVSDMLDDANTDRHYTLRLYVAGQTPKSLTAIGNLQRIAEQNIGAGRYTIEVVDLLVDPALAAGDQILAVPTLVRRLPPPLKRIIGTLSDTERVLVGLDIVPVAKASE